MRRMLVVAVLVLAVSSLVYVGLHMTLGVLLEFVLGWSDMARIALLNVLSLIIAVVIVRRTAWGRRLISAPPTPMQPGSAPSAPSAASPAAPWPGAQR
jgi:hypothetical protein